MNDKPKKKFHLSKRSIYITLAVFLLLGGSYVYFRTNISFREVVDSKVYCSRQPSEAELRRWITEYNLKTIINLRGYAGKETAEEVAVAEEMNVRHISLTLSAYSLPPSYVLSRLIREIETCQKPVLIHCYSGIDRSGLAAPLAAMAIGGEDYYEARKHGFVAPEILRKIKQEDVHISDVFLKFEDYCRLNGLKPDWPRLKNWADNIYQQYNSYYFVSYSLPEEVILAPGQGSIIRVGITNNSKTAIPAAASKFRVFAYLGEAISRGSDFKLLGPYTPLESKDIEPGETVIVKQEITAPVTPGRYDVNLDIIREGSKRSFEAKGSPIGTFRLIVTRPN